MNIKKKFYNFSFNLLYNKIIIIIIMKNFKKKKNKKIKKKKIKFF